MKKYHCFFEQSGTFKNEFKKLGYEAFDYDILNDFNETDYVIDLYDEIEKSYLGLNSIFDKMQIDKNIPLIIENPYSEQHYLKRYWCIKPKIIDMNRRERGDHFIKPTQYWFINCEPKNNFIFEPLLDVKYKTVDSQSTVGRSMIHPQYANRFIREFIIDENN